MSIYEVKDGKVKLFISGRDITDTSIGGLVLGMHEMHHRKEEEKEKEKKKKEERR